MLGDVEMHDATAVVSRNHEHEKHPERHRRYDKKVHIPSDLVVAHYS